MKEILFGDTNTNIIQKLRVSWFARLIFAGCCWYCYDIFGVRTKIHIDKVIMIFVMGLFIVNMIYIPFRILGSLNLSRKIKLLFVIVADIVTLYYWNHAREFSIASFWKDYVAGTIITLSITGIIIALYRLLEVHQQNGKDVGQMFDDLNGWEFEKWCAEWLKRNGFVDVVVTSGSGDYGADVLCSKNGLTYAVQCKKYSGKVPYRAVEEVVCAMNYYHTQRAMIFTNSVLTAQASEAAKKLGVIVYDSDIICR